MSLIHSVIIASALLHARAYVFFTLDASNKYSVTEDWTIIRHTHVSQPLILRVNNSLVHILDSNDTSHAIHLESSDFPLCKLPLKLVYPQRYPRRAASLGNGKIVVWLLNYRLTAYRRVAEWRFAVVEPRSCTHRGFAISDVDPTPVDVVDVVGYEDTLDVFMTGMVMDEPRNTYVYRYSDEGKPVSSVVNSVIPDLDSHPFYRPNTIRVHPVKEHDPSEGYFYVQTKPVTNSTVVKRLGAKFEVLYNTILSNLSFHGFGFDTYSVSHGEFTACRHSNDKAHYLNCILLDDKLMQRVNVSLSHGNCKQNFTSLAHVDAQSLPDDAGVLLVYATKTSHRVGTPIYVQRIYADGRIGEPKRIGKVYCEIYRLQSIEMKDGLQCIAVTCDEVVHTRCIRI